MLSTVQKSVQDQHEGERQGLLTHLLDAVKQCQIRFGGKTELATETDSRVCCLCACWEAVLQHGLKHTNKALSTLKQVTEMTGLAKIGTGLGLLDDIKNMETEPSFWQCMKPMLNQHENQRFLSLRNISTEEGRGRACIRAALNEHSMERYMHLLVENTQHLSIFYEDWAFLRDHEKSSMLPNMARGLGSILFAISIDKGELNSIKPATGLDSLVSLSVATTPVLPTPPEPEPQPVIGGDTRDREKRKDKKKRKKPAKIVSFDGDDSSYSASPLSSVTSPLSKSSSFDLNSPMAVSLNKNQPRTGFVFPSLAVEPAKSDTESEKSTNVENFQTEIGEESEKENDRQQDEQLPLATANTDRENIPEMGVESEGLMQRKQKFPGVNDVLGMSGVKTWQDVLGIDSAVENQKETLDAKVLEGKLQSVELEEKEDHNSGSLATAEAHIEEMRKASETPKVDLPSENLSENFPPNPTAALQDEVFTESPTSCHENTLDKPEPVKSDSSDQDCSAQKSSLDHIESKVNTSTVSSKDTVRVTRTTAATIKMAGAIQEVDQPTASKLTMDSVKTVESGKGTDQPTASRSTMDSVKSSGPIQETGQPTASKPTMHSAKSVPAFNNSAPVSLPSVKSVPLMSDFNAVPSHVRTLPSGNSVDNADAQSNLSFGSVSSTGEAFLGTMSTDVNLMPVSAEGKVEITEPINDSSSSNTESVDSYAVYHEATESAMQAVVMAQKGFLSSLRTQGDGSNAPTPSITPNDTMTTGELKQAVIAMMMRKDEVEEHNTMLRQMLEDEMERTASLKAEMEELKASHRTQQDTDSEKIREVTRENDLLKHQLRKYVNAVQMLRRQGASDEEFSGLHLDSVQPTIPPATTRAYSHEAGEYEKKLVQVAEMHGELIELNERLQKSVQNKDVIIKHMRGELEDLRGPLPSDLHSGDDASSIHSESSEINNRSLINVWIPSAFLRGTSKENYHVYQVYIRIRDEEWNVYRRYTEFREMHLKLKKTFPATSALDFPPKKSIGSKDARFVEQRRRKLQVYLRKMLNMLAHANPELCTHGCKQRLIAMLPLFGNQPVADKKNKKRDRSSSRGRSAGSSSSASSPPVQVYNGL